MYVRGVFEIFYTLRDTIRLSMKAKVEEKLKILDLANRVNVKNNHITTKY